MGTGSGILSLAAAKLWQDNCKITAVDIDEEAILVTRQNAIDNNLESFITAEVSNGYQSDLVKNNVPYDLILANILARPLIEMAPDLYKSLKIGGYCILSGFVEGQENWVIEEHTKLGLKLKQIYKLDNWRAALLEKA
jgi:ribosomal protein L11 methyltransferase